jgi:hypothetical protein
VKAFFLIASVLAFFSTGVLLAGDTTTSVSVDVSRSREVTVGGLRVVLLGVGLETLLTGEKDSPKAFRQRLRLTYLIEEIDARADPKEGPNTGNWKVYFAGTNTPAFFDPATHQFEKDGPQNIIATAYPYDKFAAIFVGALPKVIAKDRTVIFTVDFESARGLRGKDIDVRVKGIGIGGSKGSCEFRKIPLG